MLDSEYRGGNNYIPVGVWAQAVENANDVTLGWLDPDSAYASEAGLILARIVEQNLNYPEDLFEYWATNSSTYSGSRGPIYTSRKYASTEACAEDILNIVGDNVDTLAIHWRDDTSVCSRTYRTDCRKRLQGSGINSAGLGVGKLPKCSSFLSLLNFSPGSTITPQGLPILHQHSLRENNHSPDQYW